jgi:hypothetical protein
MDIMRRGCLPIFLVLSLALVSYADDREKAEKQIRMMTAMSRDNTARSIVNRTFADVFKTERDQLIAERVSLGLNYGSLFVAHELVLSGSSMQQISGQLRANKTLLEIANSSSADWKRIASDAKKMNDRIHKGIYKHFLHDKADQQQDQTDHYTASADLIRADMESTRDELLKARADYMFWRNLAAPKSVGQADAFDPVVHTYNNARDEIAVTHGTTNPSNPDNR